MSNRYDEDLFDKSRDAAPDRRAESERTIRELRESLRMTDTELRTARAEAEVARSLADEALRVADRAVRERVEAREALRDLVEAGADGEGDDSTDVEIDLSKIDPIAY